MEGWEAAAQEMRRQGNSILSNITSAQQRTDGGRDASNAAPAEASVLAPHVAKAESSVRSWWQACGAADGSENPTASTVVGMGMALDHGGRVIKPHSVLGYAENHLTCRC